MKNSFQSIGWLLAIIVLGTCGCSKQARKGRMIERADKDFHAEQFDKAEIEYMNAMQLVPGDPVAIRQLGLIYFAEGRVVRAYRFLQKADELIPDNVEVQKKLASTYVAVRKIKEARELALQVLAKQPGDEDALIVLVETATTPKEFQATQALIAQMQSKNKDAASYHLALGMLFFRGQELYKAEREYRTAIRMDPKSGATVALGNLYWLRGDLAEAEASFSAAYQNAPPRSSRSLKYADFLIKNGKMDAGKKILEEVTAKTPDYIPAWSPLIEIAFAQNQTNECAMLIKKVLLRDPENYDALLTSANLKLAGGDTAEAITEFERMETGFGESFKTQYGLAMANLKNGDVNKAIRFLERAVALNPGFTQAALALSEVQIRQGNAVIALPRLLTLTKTQPKLVQAQMLLASAYTAEKKLPEAEAVYRQMTTLFPKEPQPRLFLGMHLLQQNKPAEARKAFEDALRVSPEFPAATENLVALDVLEKKYSNATERVEEQIKKTPNAAEPWFWLARVQLSQDKKKDAEVSLQKCISLNPDFRAAYMVLAQIYVDSHQEQAALAKLNKVIETTNDVSVLMQIGMIHDRLKDHAAARDAYEKILTVNPRFSPALNNLAYIYSEHLVQLDKAYEMAQKARQLLPYEPSVADTLGWILFKRGDYRRALGLLQESANKLLLEPEVELHLGMTYYMLDQEKPARRALESALQSTNTFPGKELIQPALAILAIDGKTASPAAIDTLEKRIKDEPRDLPALSRLVAIYEQKGAIDKVVDMCEKAIKVNPSNAQFSAKLARVYSTHLKNPQKAFEYAKQAHSAALDDPSISHLLGRLAYETGDFKWGLSLLQEAALKLPKQADVLRDLAWSYYSLGRVAEAEETMQAASEASAPSEKDSASVFLAMIKAQESRELAAKSAAQAQEIIKKDPDYAPALMTLALADEQKKDFSSARDLYDKVLVKYPLFTPAMRQLSILYANHLNDDSKAYELGLKARAASSDDEELTKTLGKLAYRKGDYAKSAQFLKESVRAQATDADSLYYLGMAQYRLKDSAGSKNSLQRALKLNLSADLATEARKILTELK